jgi:hypothetical protein
VFDPPPVEDPDTIPNKPLLTAAYKAKKEQFSKSFSVGDFSFSAVERDTSIHDDFSRSVPSNLIASDDRIEFRPSRLASDKIKAMPTPLEGDDENPCEALQEVQTDGTPRRKKQGVGLGSRLLKEAIIFKENSLNDSSSLVHPDDADDSVISDHMSTSKDVSKSKDVTLHSEENTIDLSTTLDSETTEKDLGVVIMSSSSPERMSWWKTNGRRFVEAQFDPALESEKKVLTKSLIAHNLSTTETKKISQDGLYSSTNNETVDVTPKKKDDVVSTAEGSLSEKRRKAAEARERALKIRNEGQSSTNPGSQGERTVVEDSTPTNFKQAMASLQNRVDASVSKEPVKSSPTGNARAMEWAHAASATPEQNERNEDEAPKITSDRLDWWGKNGKRLVKEKLEMAQIAGEESPKSEPLKSEPPSIEQSDKAETQTQNYETSLTESTPEAHKMGSDPLSRRELLAEKRRQIIEMRMALKTGKTANADETKTALCTEDGAPRGVTDFAYSESNEDEEERRRKARVLEAQRIAERTRQSRENRLAREAVLAEATQQVAHSTDLGEDTGNTAKGVPPSILSPMIREADRLSGFICRYENKLETVCRTLLTVASEDPEKKEAIVAAKELPLAEMHSFIVQQDWYKSQSSAVSAGQPCLMFSKSQSGQSFIDSQVVAKEMASEKGKKSDDQVYAITTVAKAFMQMDGPVQGDVCRFLAHIGRTEGGLKKDAMVANWKEIARLSGDAQSQRISDTVDELISFCLDSHMIK